MEVAMSPSAIGMMFTAQVLGMGLCVQPATKLSDKAAANGDRLIVMLPGIERTVSIFLDEKNASGRLVFYCLGVRYVASC